jgi:internalin A
VRFWSDRDIEPGARWHNEIQEELDCAKVALLLVSPAFLASSYITSNELPNMLRAAESEGMKLFWIPVRESAYRHSPISEFQAAHPPQSPLASLSRAQRDRAWVEIGEKLARSLEVIP